MPTCSNIVIVDGCRTPIGCFRWSLSEFSSVQLATSVIAETVNRCRLTSDQIDTVYLGCVLTANTGQNIARHAALSAGLPVSVSATTITRSCSSGLIAIQLAIKALLLDEATIAIAGGVDSESNAPYLTARSLAPTGHQFIQDDIIADAMYDPWICAHPAIAAEHTADIFDISRIDQDTFAIESYRRAQMAIENGIFIGEILPIPLESSSVDCDDEPIKFNQQKLLSMTPAFKENGTLTAGNSSSLADGAAAVLLMTMETAKQLHLHPIARVLGYADEAGRPIDFNTAAVKTINKLLDECNRSKNDIDRWEISEAYAVTTLAVIRQLQLDPSRVNMHGGCVSLGHPFGATGARLVLHLCYTMCTGQLAIIGLGNGGGEASALMIEKI